MKQLHLPFQFSGKMARLLGRESVSGEVAALYELVKNAYDADATKITISFKNFSDQSKESSTITISDDGEGMNMKEIEENWLIIGTYSKDKTQRSKSGRLVVGNKGIGRFAIEKLSEKTLMISKPKNDPEEIKLHVNWNDYEKKDTTFNDIENLVEINPERSDSENHGITIILSELRDEWTAEKIRNLRLSVSRIVMPEKIVPSLKLPFDVIIDDPDFQTSIDEKVQSNLFEKAPYKITSSIQKDSKQFNVHLFKEGLEKDTKKVDLSTKKLDSGGDWKNFGKCKFSLYFFPGGTPLEPWNKYYRVNLKIAKISEYLSEINGVKIYRDNFMVRPYGEKGNDWLNLEKERVQSNLSVGNTQVIGFVEISKDDNPKIKDTTTRERLVENEEFESMSIFVSESIKVLSKFRIAEHDELKEEKTRIEHKNAIELETRYISELIEDTPNIPVIEKKKMIKSLRIITKTFNDYEFNIDEKHKELSRLKRTYRNLASLGISSASSSHEINNIMAVMSEIPKSIISEIKKAEPDKEEIKNDVDEIKEYIRTIKQFLGFVRQYVRNVKNDYLKKQEREKIVLDSTIRKLLDAFKGIVISKKLDLELKIFPDDLVIHMNRADLYSITINMLTNSMKALDLLPPDSSKKIKITIEKQANSIKFLFSNNGPKIKESRQEAIFDIFESDYEEGTGLGLSIVREIIDEYDGTIEIKANPEFDPGVTFMIKFPIGEVQKK